MNLSASVSAMLGKPVEVVDMLSEADRRNTVARLRVTAGGNVGRTVIAKQTVGFDEPDAGPEVRLRLYREAIAGTVLTRLEPGEHTARCLGVDPRNGLMIFDDLGADASLVQPLLEGGGPDARAAMISYVRRLAALHAATAGRLALWDQTVAELGAPQELRTAAVLDQYGQSFDNGVAGLHRQLRDLGITPTSEADAELARELASIRTTVTQPGPFTVLVHQDPCPDNVVITKSGIRLIDFEFARPGHALIDGLYPQLPFPTCWCCNLVPDGFAAELAAVYRKELITGVPEAANDDLYADATIRLIAYWLITSFERFFEAVLTESWTWGIASTRSRQLSRLDVFIRSARESRRLPALRRIAEELHRLLADRWAPEIALPVYPAFRNTMPST